MQHGSRAERHTRLAAVGLLVTEALVMLDRFPLDRLPQSGAMITTQIGRRAMMAAVLHCAWV